jgi:hypothetical protein
VYSVHTVQGLLCRQFLKISFSSKESIFTKTPPSSFRWDPIGLNQPKKGKPGTVQKKPIFPKKFLYPKQQHRAQFDSRQPQALHAHPTDISRIDVVIPTPQQRPPFPRSAAPWQNSGRPAVQHVPEQLIARPNQLFTTPADASATERRERKQNLPGIQDSYVFRYIQYSIPVQLTEKLYLIFKFKPTTSEEN